MMNAVSKLPASIKEKVVGGVLFGYTKNAQQKGKIPNYPADKVKVFCNPSGTPGRYKDGVCGGTLNVNGGHFAYMGNGDGPKALTFLQSKIDPALSKTLVDLPKPGSKGPPATAAPEAAEEEE
jgi:cutinase